MNTDSKKEIMYDSNEAAQKITMEVWRDFNGRIWTDESVARYSGCTHRPCEICGMPAEKAYITCKKCRWDKKVNRYNSYPLAEWTEDVPVFSESVEEYFDTEDDLISFIEEQLEYDPEFKSEDMMLVLCDSIYPRTLDESYWDGQMPEDGGEMNKEVKEKIKELNALLRIHPPLSYTPGKQRVTYKYVAE